MGSTLSKNKKKQKKNKKKNKNKRNWSHHEFTIEDNEPTKKVNAFNYILFHPLAIQRPVKMATKESNACFWVPKKTKNLHMDKDQCVSCRVLNDEITRIVSKLKYAWEIIRILQENVKNTDSTVTASRLKMAAAWTKIEHRRQGRKQPKSRSNLITIPTSNRFSPFQEYEEK